MIYPIQEETLKDIADAVKRLNGTYDDSIAITDLAESIKRYATKYNTEVYVNATKVLRAPFGVTYTDYHTQATCSLRRVNFAHFNAVQGSTIYFYDAAGTYLKQVTVPVMSGSACLHLTINAPWLEEEPIPGSPEAAQTATDTDLE